MSTVASLGLSTAFDVRHVCHVHTVIAVLLYAASLWATEGGRVAAPLCLAVLFLSTVVAEALTVRDEGARPNVAQGLVVSAPLLPLLFLGQRKDGWVQINDGFVITWLTALGVCAYHGMKSVVAVKAAIGAAVVLLNAALLWVWYSEMGVAFSPLGSLQYGWRGVAGYVFMMKTLPKSFSEGECLILSQLGALVMFAATQAEMLTKLRVVMLFGVHGALGLALFILILRALNVRGAVYYPIVAVGFAGVIHHISIVLGEDSLVWLWGYLTVQRAIPLYCVLYFVVVIVVGLRYAPTGFLRKHQTIARKYFHALALIMFVPTAMVHIRFLALAFSVAISVFVVIECMRITEVQPLSQAVNSVMNRYIDEKDGGTVVMTHIYLLLGLAMPVWYVFVSYHGGVFSARSLLSATTGMTVTGLGDACASVFGVTYGKHKWAKIVPTKSRKTLEGSAAMLLSIVLFQCALLQVYGFADMAQASWVNLLLSNVLIVVLEAVTDQVDNMLLPLCHLVVLQMV